MEQPYGFNDPTHPQHVYWLYKSFYNLMQALRLGIFIIVGFYFTMYLLVIRLIHLIHLFQLLCSTISLIICK
jgi:hypothetical protein